MDRKCQIRLGLGLRSMSMSCKIINSELKKSITVSPILLRYNRNVINNESMQNVTFFGFLNTDFRSTNKVKIETFHFANIVVQHFSKTNQICNNSRNLNEFWHTTTRIEKKNNFIHRPINTWKKQDIFPILEM